MRTRVNSDDIISQYRPGETMYEFRKRTRFHYDTIYRHFGSWKGLKKKAEKVQEN